MASSTEALCEELAERLLPTASEMARRMGLTFGVSLTVKPVATNENRPVRAPKPRRPNAHPKIVAMELAVRAFAKEKRSSKDHQREAVIYAARAHFNLSFQAIAKHFETTHELVFDAYCRGIAKVDDDEPAFSHLVYHAKKGGVRA